MAWKPNNNNNSNNSGNVHMCVVGIAVLTIFSSGGIMRGADVLYGAGRAHAASVGVCWCMLVYVGECRCVWCVCSCVWGGGYIILAPW